MYGNCETQHRLTMVDKKVTQMIRHMKWPELLEFVKQRYPDAYMSPLNEIAFFQIGNQQSVFRHDCFISEEFLKTNVMYNPYFTDTETQKHFSSLNLCIVDKSTLRDMIEQFVDRQYVFCYNKWKMYQQAVERQKIMQMKHRKYYLVRALKNMKYIDFNEDPEEKNIAYEGSWLHVVDLVKLYKGMNWLDYDLVYSRW